MDPIGPVLSYGQHSEVLRRSRETARAEVADELAEARRARVDADAELDRCSGIARAWGWLRDRKDWAPIDALKSFLQVGPGRRLSPADRVALLDFVIRVVCAESTRAELVVVVNAALAETGRGPKGKA